MTKEKRSSLGILQANLEKSTRNLNNAQHNLAQAKVRIAKALAAHDKAKKELSETYETVLGVNRS